MQYVDPGDRVATYDRIVAASENGHTVPMFVGSDTAPRHAVLADPLERAARSRSTTPTPEPTRRPASRSAGPSPSAGQTGPRATSALPDGMSHGALSCRRTDRAARCRAAARGVHVRQRGARLHRDRSRPRGAGLVGSLGGSRGALGPDQRLRVQWSAGPFRRQSRDRLHRWSPGRPHCSRRGRRSTTDGSCTPPAAHPGR